MTNLVVTTDRRTYMIELRAREALYMPSVAWAYPAQPASQRQTVPAAPIIPAGAGETRHRAHDRCASRVGRLAADHDRDGRTGHGGAGRGTDNVRTGTDRKSTRLNSSH